MTRFYSIGISLPLNQLGRSGHAHKKPWHVNTFLPNRFYEQKLESKASVALALDFNLMLSICPITLLCELT